MSKNPTLQFLEDVRDRLEHVDYDLIYQSIADLKDKFVPTALLKKDTTIDRVRINKTDDPFKKIEDVSYIHDEDILKKYVGFGRANLPGQAIFYGSIITQQIEQPRVAAYFETSELVRQLNDTEIVEEKFTLSRWRVKEDIELLEMIFTDEALEVNEYVRNSLDDKLNKLSNMPLKDHYVEQGRFFSNEFARMDVGPGEDHKYKITAAYMNYICEKAGLLGISYPSVPTEYKGQNVALFPKAVDEFLELELVGLFQFKGKNEDNLVTLLKYCKDFGKDKKDFQWLDYKDDVKF